PAIHTRYPHTNPSYPQLSLRFPQGKHKQCSINSEYGKTVSNQQKFVKFPVDTTYKLMLHCLGKAQIVKCSYVNSNLFQRVDGKLLVATANNWLLPTAYCLLS